MLENIKLIAQSAIRIENSEGKVIYFDPFKITDEFNNDADYIFITHSHYDHFSKEDINKIKKDNTKIVVTKDITRELENMGFNNILSVDPNKEYKIDDINFKTIPAYNIDKTFHKKEYNWVGYIVNINNEVIYVAGDTDNTVEAREVTCDIAFVPIGGTYTMNVEEAAELIKTINPKVVVPTHYETIVGSIKDAYDFQNKLKNNIEVKILMK